MNKKETFDALFRNTYPKLFFYARSIVGEESDAEDVVEEVFCNLWSHIDTVDMGDKIEGFLYRAVYTHSLNLLKRRGASGCRIAAIEDINAIRLEQLESSQRNPQQHAENLDLRRQLETAIAELPDKCKKVFCMSYIDGMKNNEIAIELGVSLRTIEAHMYNALRYLRKRLGNLTFALLVFYGHL